MIHISELVGAELPLLQEKEEGMFTHEELIYLYEDVNNYNVVGFKQLDTDGLLFEKLYSKTGSEVGSVVNG